MSESSASAKSNDVSSSLSSERPPTAPKKPQPKRPTWRRNLGILSTFIVFLYLLIFIILPWAGLRYLEHWYAQQGDGYELSIGGWTLSPWSGRINFSNVKATYPTSTNKQSGSSESTSKETGSSEISSSPMTSEASFDYVGVDLLLSDLIDKVIHIENIALSGLTLNGSLNKDDVLRLAGINLSTGSSSPKEAPVEPENSETGPLPAGWLLRLDKIELEDNQVRWQQPGLLVDVKVNDISGGPFISDSDQSVPISISGQLRKLNVAQGDFNLTLNKPIDISLDATAKHLLGNPSAEGTLELGELNLTTSAAGDFTLASTRFDGINFVMTDDDIRVSLATLDLKNIYAQIPEVTASEGLGKVNLDRLIVNKVKWSQKTDLVTLDEFSIEGLDTQPDSKMRFVLTNASIKTFVASALTASPNVAFGQAQFAGFEGNLPDIPTLSLSELSLDKLDATALTDMPKAVLEKLSASGFKVQHTPTGEIMLAGLQLDNISADKDNQEVGRLSLSNISVMPAGVDESLLSLASYQIDDIKLSPSGLVSGIHEFSGLVARITREQNGNIKGVPSEPADTSSSANTSFAEEQTAQPDVGQDYRIQIAGLKMRQGETKTQIFWRDRGITPNNRTQLDIHELSVGSLDTANLNQPVDLHLLAGLDQYNRIRADGKIGLRGDYPEGQMEVKIEQLNLVDFNAYIVNAIGYNLQRGMLTVTANPSITEGQLGGTVKIRLQNSKFEPADQETIDRISKQISMPLETALSVLKDDNNNLRIEVPLSGDISQPDVGINDVISQVSRKAVRTATLYYLQQSLQPYGSMLSLASFAKDKLFAIRLDDLTFAEGETVLTDEHKKYLDTVAKMMKSKTDLELQVCPVASVSEVATWSEEWPSLVTERALNVKTYLGNIKDAKEKALARRITVCAATQRKQENNTALGAVIMGVE
ncbi:MAG: DUF748 domain-containing protein [Oleibacter sp.]|nr:DUF748 domain-containing protein [Thalassolituus sp.]